MCPVSQSLSPVAAFFLPRKAVLTKGIAHVCCLGLPPQIELWKPGPVFQKVSSFLLLSFLFFFFAHQY